MEHKCSDLSVACTLNTDLSVNTPKADGLTSGGSSYSSKRHRSLNGMARQAKITLPPLPPVSKPGHKKQNSSPTSVGDWDINDHLGSLDMTVRKEPEMIDSLELIFSPRRLIPVNRAVTRPQRCSSPSDYLGTRCACSILKDNFSFRFRQEQLLLDTPTLSSTL